MTHVECVRNAVDQALDELELMGQRFLGLDPVGDVATGAENTDHLPAIVASRTCAQLQPAQAAIDGAQAETFLLGLGLS